MNTEFIVEVIPSKLNHGLILRWPNGIKVTHIPTGLSAQSTEERTPHKNKAVAMFELEVMLKNRNYPTATKVKDQLDPLIRAVLNKEAKRGATPCNTTKTIQKSTISEGSKRTNGHCVGNVYTPSRGVGAHYVREHQKAKTIRKEIEEFMWMVATVICAIVIGVCAASIV
jgi:hypothetical protein